jgi:L-alanine-DL-glutamate epimerase-like enolase superfamily enzyme
MTVIERVTVHEIRYPLPRPMLSRFGALDVIYNVVAEVAADGQTGVGYTWGFDDPAATRIRELTASLARTLPGTDGADLRARTSDLRAAALGPGPEPVMAASALDTALWDLSARLRGLPLSVALGRPPATHAMYGSGGSFSLSSSELADEALSFQDRGYAGYKLRVGHDDLGTDIERILAVKERVRPGFFVAVDANQGWSRDQAARACDRLADTGLAWIEEPLKAADIEGLADLHRRTAIPIAAGETLPGTEPNADLVRERAVDIFQPDIMNCGGVTPFLELTGLAAQHQVQVMPHLFAELGAHLMAGLPTGTLIEHLDGWFEHLFSRSPVQRSGTVTATADPGFGLELNRETLRRYGRARTEI